MASNNYIGDATGVARRLIKGYVGDDKGVARRLLKGYIGDSKGVAQLIYSAGIRWLKYVAGITDEGYAVEMDPITAKSRYEEYTDGTRVLTYGGYEMYDNGVDSRGIPDYGVKMIYPYNTPAGSLNGRYMTDYFNGWRCAAQYILVREYQPEGATSVYEYELRPVMQLGWVSIERPYNTGELVGTVTAPEQTQPEAGDVIASGVISEEDGTKERGYYFIKTADGLFYYEEEEIVPRPDESPTTALLGEAVVGTLILNDGGN